MPYYNDDGDRYYLTENGKPVSLKWLLGQPGVKWQGKQLVLECSTKGDPRFSAFQAVVGVYGAKTSIEWHYQTSKMIPKYDGYGDVVTDDNGEPVLRQVEVPMAGKGKEPAAIKIGDLILGKGLSTQWYSLLWIKYLDNHPDLVTYLKNFDGFTDQFKGKSLNCQADVITKYVADREALMEECQILFNILKQQSRVEKQYQEENEWDMSTHH